MSFRSVNFFFLTSNINIDCWIFEDGSFLKDSRKFLLVIFAKKYIMKVQFRKLSGNTPVEYQSRTRAFLFKDFGRMRLILEQIFIGGKYIHIRYGNIRHIISFGRSNPNSFVLFYFNMIYFLVKLKSHTLPNSQFIQAFTYLNHTSLGKECAIIHFQMWDHRHDTRGLIG